VPGVRGYVSLASTGPVPGLRRPEQHRLAQRGQVSTFPRKARGATSAPVPVRLAELDGRVHTRTSAGLGELNRLLGGGLVAACVVLPGGEAGVGKSTRLLQSLLSMERAAVPHAAGMR